MSHHRAAVLDLATSLSRLGKRLVGDDVARDLLSAGLTRIRVVPFDSAAPSLPSVSPLKVEAEELIRRSPPEDFRTAEIVIELTSRERTGRCVAGSVVSVRRYKLVDVRITAGVETRWLHPFSATEFSRQWVLA